jgi:hypothetical protein
VSFSAALLLAVIPLITEKLMPWRFVTGHDFSRAAKANQINGL